MKDLAQVKIGDTFFGGNNPLGADNLQGIGGLVSIFLKISFSLAGLILLFFFIMGGIGMISSAGKNDPKTAEQAKQTLTSAVIGFVVVLTAYWIVKLLESILNIPNLI